MSAAVTARLYHRQAIVMYESCRRRARRLALSRDFTMLHVGCGGERTIARLAATAMDGEVYGVGVKPKA